MLAVLEMIDEENKRIFKNGEKSGIKKGRREGRKEKERETAKRMLDEGLDVDLIAKVTDLSKEEIKNLK